MHECAALLPNVGLNHTHSCCKSLPPAVSPYASANVCVAPVPALGVTASAVTTGTTGAGTVQVPRVFQPLGCVPLVAYMKMVCVPANAGVNVTANVSVSVFPLGTAVLLPSAIAHWLFCSVPLPPSCADSHVAPASSIKLSVFAPRR